MAVRAAAAAGAAGVLLPTRGGRLVNAEVIQASAGTVFRIPLVATAHLVRDLGDLKERGFWIYALEAGAEESLYEIDWPARCVLVVGNETRGLRPSIRQAADAVVRIPLAAGVESLNVAVAAGVALFEIRRCRS
jgi:23S rRNA (guanosine2251-2'-O)-methyltransferase